MANYYYLVPTLPALRPGVKPKLDLKAYMELCSGKLSRKDYSRLESLVDGDDEAAGRFADGYKAFASTLKALEVSERAKRLGLPARKAPECDGALVRQVASIVALADPLQAEKELMALHFKYIDDHIGAIDYFGLENLMGYALKLRLLSRLDSFGAEGGEAEFGRMLSSLREEINSKGVN